MQSARDRRRSEGQDVHLGAELLDALLVRHAEALLLIHDQQPQVLDRHVIAQQAVRTDHQVYAAVGQARKDTILLRRSLEAREHGDADGERCQPAGEVGVVLLRQYGRRHQDGDLLVVHDRLEGRAERHLGFPVAHVPADQPIHGPGLLHVLLDRLDGDELILGFDVGEAGLQLVLPCRVRAERVALHHLARRVELQQVVGDLGDSTAGALFDLFPLRGAQPVQGGNRLPRADVAGQPVGLMHGHVELVALGILDLQVLAFRAIHGHPDQAVEAADAVLDMHHEVARLHIGEEHFRRHRPRPLRPPRLRLPPTKQLGVREEPESGSWLLEARSWKLVAGCRLLVAGN